jgi:hypothetical protein
MQNHKGNHSPEVAQPQEAKKNVGGVPADWMMRKVMEGVRNTPAKGSQYTWLSTCPLACIWALLADLLYAISLQAFEQTLEVHI